MVLLESNGKHWDSLVKQKIFHSLTVDGIVITHQNWTETVTPWSSLTICVASSPPFFQVTRDLGSFNTRRFGYVVLY
jgi:hypothetical protein